jgi:D-beta-D-heptose 7-phosphate kinase / D-beta-D-heptose 1-phosphate adenosyltransferase
MISKMEKKEILVFGDLMLDEYVYGTVDRISPEAPIPVLRKTDTEYKLGGAANVAYSLSRLKETVEVFGYIGQDASGSIIKQKLIDAGISCNRVLESLVTTTTKTRYVSGGKQMLRLDAEDYNLQYIENEFFEELAKSPNKIIFSDYNKGACTNLPAKLHFCRMNNIVSFVDPKHSDWSNYRYANVITPNLKEFNEANTPELSEMDKAVFLINEYEIDYICLTKGSLGFVLYDQDGLVVSDTPKTQEVVDVSGAGDTFLATLASYWPTEQSSSYTINEAALVANLASSISVSKFGTYAVSDAELRLKHKSSKAKNNKIFEEWFDLKEHLDLQYGSKIIFTNGCFDLLHVGHIKYLEEARARGNILVVCLNSDKSVAELKGEGRPINSQSDRALMLSSLSCVDYVTYFDDPTPKKIYDYFLPKYIAKGGDYVASSVVGAEVVERNGGEIYIIDFISGYSSTNMIQKIIQT